VDSVSPPSQEKKGKTIFNSPRTKNRYLSERCITWCLILLARTRLVYLSTSREPHSRKVSFWIFPCIFMFNEVTTNLIRFWWVLISAHHSQFMTYVVTSSVVNGRQKPTTWTSWTHKTFSSGRLSTHDFPQCPALPRGHNLADRGVFQKSNSPAFPIAVAWTVFTRSNTGIVGSNPTRGMDLYMLLFRVCVVLCVDSGLATGWSPVKGVLPTVYILRNWKSGQGLQGL
jgi:hypothetical protein